MVPSVGMWNMGLFPFSGLEVGWDLVTDIIAVIAGAALYKETA